MDFRQECFLFELPYDARLSPGFVHHVKDDPTAEREPDWEGFDLQTWLNLDTPPIEGSMCSTTLMFSVGECRRDTLSFVRAAWPAVFKRQLDDHPWPHRFFYYRPVMWLRDRLPRSSNPVERRTVVQAIRIVARPAELTNDWKHEQLRTAHSQLSRYLEAAASVHGDPELQPPSLQDLPPVVLGFGFDVPPNGFEPRSIERNMHVIHERLASRPRYPMTRSEADVAMWMSVAHDHPMVAVMGFLLSAGQSQYRGRATHAVVDAGTAMEMLVSAGLRIAGPERGYTEAKVDKVLGGPFRSRVIDHFAPVCEYDPDVERSTDPLGRWWRDGYRLRNRVVHEGLKPCEDEVDRAVGAAHALFRDLGARLSANPALKSKLIPIPDELAAAAQVEREMLRELYGNE